MDGLSPPVQVTAVLGEDRTMTLQEILTKVSDIPASANTVVYLDGGIRPDGIRPDGIRPDNSQEYFRLYPNPQDVTKYFLIKATDIKGDPCEWTKDEMLHAGFVGTKLYRLAIARGTQVQLIQVSTGRLGETIPGNASATSAKDFCSVNDIRCVDGERQRCVFSPISGPFWEPTGEKCKCP
jgi:hypothetical protein